VLSNNYGRRGEISERVSGGERLGSRRRALLNKNVPVRSLSTLSERLTRNLKLRPSLSPPDTKARLLDSVMPRQLTAADEQSENKAKASRGGVEDPHAVPLAAPPNPLSKALPPPSVTSSSAPTHMP
jgi:hypothetical protein